MTIPMIKMGCISHITKGLTGSKIETLYYQVIDSSIWGQGLTRTKLESRMNKIVPYPLGYKIESSEGPIYKRGN